MNGLANTSSAATDGKNQAMVSIVVPIYNAERYLHAALDSAAQQSHQNIEIMMVDDGSSDSSSGICEGYCRKDLRFRLITQDNQGVSAARNRGVAEAEGEWIAFLDADDIMPEDAVQTLLDAVMNTGTKIAVGRFVRGTEPRHYETGHGNQVQPSDDAILTGLYQKRILNSPCGVLFHSSIFRKAPELKFRDCRYEDLDFFYRAFERTDRICLVDDVVYLYRDNPESFINTWSMSRLDALDVTDRIVEHMKSRGDRLYRAALDRRFSAHFNILLLMLKNGVDLPQQTERCLRVIREQRLNELKDPNVRLKNKLGALTSYLGMPAMKLLCRF